MCKSCRTCFKFYCMFCFTCELLAVKTSCKFYRGCDSGFNHACLVVYRVSQKSRPPTTFNDIFAWAESFCTKFYTLIGNLYPHMCTDFRLFILTCNEMALILSRSPIIFSARQHAERAICYRPSVRVSVCLSVCLSVRRTGGSVKNG